MSRLTITPESHLFPMFQKVIKAVEYPKKEVTIKTIDRKRSEILRNNTYIYLRFLFDWQTPDICGIDVYQLENDNG
jgi:hypothetical protein